MSNENQPRVPAGSPDGGQWTDGGGGLPSPALADKLKLVGQMQGEARDLKGHLTTRSAIHSAKALAVKEHQPQIAETLDKHLATTEKSIAYYKSIGQ